MNTEEQREAGVTDAIVEIAAEKHMRVRGIGMLDPWQTMTEATRIEYRKAMRAALLAVWPVNANKGSPIGRVVKGLHSGCYIEFSNGTDMLDYVGCELFTRPIAAEPAQPADSGRVGDSIIAGALFDLMGFLTTRDEVTTLSGRHEASPAVIALEAFAAKRGLQLDEANVNGWQAALAAQGQREAVAWLFVDHSIPNWFGFEWAGYSSEEKARKRYESYVSTGDYRDPEFIPLYAAPPASSAGVPDGMALVPARFGISKDAWEAAQFAFGGPGTGEGEEFMDCTAWVGEIENDDGSKTHGMHIQCDECPEEGSITIAEFTAAPSAPEGDGGAK